MLGRPAGSPAPAAAAPGWARGLAPRPESGGCRGTQRGPRPAGPTGTGPASAGVARAHDWGGWPPAPPARRPGGRGGRGEGRSQGAPPAPPYGLPPAERAPRLPPRWAAGSPRPTRATAPAPAPGSWPPAEGHEWPFPAAPAPPAARNSLDPARLAPRATCIRTHGSGGAARTPPWSGKDARLGVNGKHIHAPGPQRSEEAPCPTASRS